LGWHVNGHRPPAVADMRNAFGVVVIWIGSLRIIIVRRQHEHEGSWRKRRRSRIYYWVATSSGKPAFRRPWISVRSCKT
jgi:hypothetical protein